MPYVSFFLQETDLPGLTTTPAQTRPGGYTVNHAPDRINWDPLNITFLVDENLSAWRELFNWMTGIAGGHDRKPTTAKFVNDQLEIVWPDDNSENRLARLSSTYAGLTILNGAKQPKIRVLFHNLFPTTLSSVRWSTSQDPLPAMVGTATFQYDFYTIVDIE